MTTDSVPSSLPIGPDEAWRRAFGVAIRQLSVGEPGDLQVEEWAARAQAQLGHRNPVEIAHEEWVSGSRGTRS